MPIYFHLGGISFATAAPRLWKLLPPVTKDSLSSLNNFILPQGGGGRGREVLLVTYKAFNRDLGCLPFTWKTRKFQMENQMVRIISFGVLLNLWNSGQSDAFFTPFKI